LFEGWMRAAFSAAMAPLAVHVFGAVMLMILQPFLEILVGNAANRTFDMGPVITITIVVIVFLMVVVFGLGAVGAIGRGFAFSKGSDNQPTPRRLTAPQRLAGEGPGERAEQIVARIVVNDRHHAAGGDGFYSSREGAGRRTGEIADAVTSAPQLAGERLGQTYIRAPRIADRRGDG
jgi:hypothetical protein